MLSNYFFAQFIFSKLQLHSQFHQKDKEKDGGHTDTFLSVFAGQGVPALLTFPYYTMIFKGDLFVLGAAV